MEKKKKKERKKRRRRVAQHHSTTTVHSLGQNVLLQAFGLVLFCPFLSLPPAFLSVGSSPWWWSLWSLLFRFSWLQWSFWSLLFRLSWRKNKKERKKEKGRKNERKEEEGREGRERKKARRKNYINKLPIDRLSGCYW